jgi:hypothetical protein
MMLSYQSRMYPQLPTLLRNVFFSDRYRVWFQRRSQRIVPPVHEAEPCDYGRDFDDLPLVPVLSHPGKELVSNGVGLRRRGNREFHGHALCVGEQRTSLILGHSSQFFF